MCQLPACECDKVPKKQEASSTEPRNWTLLRWVVTRFVAPIKVLTGNPREAASILHSESRCGRSTQKDSHAPLTAGSSFFSGAAAAAAVAVLDVFRVVPILLLDAFSGLHVERRTITMPGSSRMPVSLRESINHVKRRKPANLAAVINLDL